MDFILAVILGKQIFKCSYIDQKGFLVFDEIFRNDRYNYIDFRIKGIEPINKDKKKD